MTNPQLERTHINMASPCCIGTNLYLRAGLDSFDVQNGSFDIEASNDMSLICACGRENIDWFEMMELNASAIQEAVSEAPVTMVSLSLIYTDASLTSKYYCVQYAYLDDQADYISIEEVDHLSSLQDAERVFDLFKRLYPCATEYVKRL